MVSNFEKLMLSDRHLQDPLSERLCHNLLEQSEQSWKAAWGEFFDSRQLKCFLFRKDVNQNELSSAVSGTSFAAFVFSWHEDQDHFDLDQQKIISMLEQITGE